MPWPNRMTNGAHWRLHAWLFIAVFALADASVAETNLRTRIEKWVETRQVLSQESSDWEVERESLRATKDLLETEKLALRAEIEELENTATSADEERRDLLLDRAGYQRASGILDQEIIALENQVRGLIQRLPAPLQKKLEPLRVQIPDAPETTRLPLGQRLMNILGVLAQAEKFNGTASFVAETREVEGGDKHQVRTLYWGLGQAIYVDAQGRTAGVGTPGPGGWEFSDVAGMAGRAEQLLDIYEGHVDTIDFVALPVVVQ